jgi:hypothetical protein
VEEQQEDMVVLRDGKSVPGPQEETENSAGRTEETPIPRENIEDRVAGMEAQLAEMRALLQVMAGRASPHTPQPVAQEHIPERASAPGQASAPVVGPQPGSGQDEPPAPVTLPQIPERGEPSCSRRPGKEPVGATAPEPDVEFIGTRRPEIQEVAPYLWGTMKLEAKVEIPEFRGDIDGEKLDAWLDRLESYFSLYGFNDLQKITFVRVKMESHALVWWNAYVQAHGMHGTTWDRFKELVRRQFYPVGYQDERWRMWLYLRQFNEHTVQEYTTDFKRRALLLGIPLGDPETFRKYLAGLSEEVRNHLKMYTVDDIDDACEKGTTIERTLFPKKYSKDRKKTPSRQLSRLPRRLSHALHPCL